MRAQYKSRVIMEIVGIIVTVAISLIMVAASFYLYIVYCHPEDKGLGTSIGCKVLIMLCQSLAYGQLLLLCLNVSEDVGTATMELIYSVIYPIIFVLVAWMVPFIIFLYEADEEDSLTSRLCWSALYAVAISLLWSALVFLSYIWLSLYTDPIGTQTRVSVPIYMMTCLCLVGWVLLALNGSVGLVFLPYQLMLDFFNRPKELSSEEAYEQKLHLQKTSVELIEKGQQLKARQEELETEHLGWFSKRRRQASLEKELERYKAQVITLEETFDHFDQQVAEVKSINSAQDAERQIRKKQTPLVFYVLSLLFGILALLVSLCWVIQLVGVSFHIDGLPLFLFVDSLLVDLAGGSISFVAIGIYSIMTLYLQAGAVKGNAVFGLRIPFIMRFHPMKKDKTYLNSFLFNVSIMMLCSAATTQMSVIAFPTYLKNTYIYLVFHQVVLNLPMFGWLYGNQVLLYAMEAILALAFAVLIFQMIRVCCRKKKQSN